MLERKEWEQFNGGIMNLVISLIGVDDETYGVIRVDGSGYLSFYGADGNVYNVLDAEWPDVRISIIDLFNSLDFSGVYNEEGERVADLLAPFIACNNLYIEYEEGRGVIKFIRDGKPSKFQSRNYYILIIYRKTE
jgi:hypothetical protein